MRAEIDRFLSSTVRAVRPQFERVVDKVVYDKPAEVKLMIVQPEKLAASPDIEQGRWARGPRVLALNYDYQGNNGGNWDEEHWLAGDFMAAGWRAG